MNLAINIFISVLCAALFFYLISVSVDLFNHLFSKYPSDGKSELHCRDRYQVAEDMKDDSDQGIFMN